jgi:hypothetical protein
MFLRIRGLLDYQQVSLRPGYFWMSLLILKHIPASFLEIDVLQKFCSFRELLLILNDIPRLAPIFDSYSFPACR